MKSAVHEHSHSHVWFSVLLHLIAAPFEFNCGSTLLSVALKQNEVQGVMKRAQANMDMSFQTALLALSFSKRA